MNGGGAQTSTLVISICALEKKRIGGLRKKETQEVIRRQGTLIRNTQTSSTFRGEVRRTGSRSVIPQREFH